MPKYYDFEVSLCEVSPRIWRRLLIPSTAKFSDLHLAIQEACGWWSYHLYAFHETPEWGRDGIIAGIPDDEYDEEQNPTPDATKVKLSSFFGKGDAETCYYLYDFGDDWWHEVIFRGVVSTEERFRRRLLGGDRAFPHEDSGGIPGYEHCVRAALHEDDGLDDPEGLRTWFGEWHPEKFDLAAAKKAFDR